MALTGNVQNQTTENEHYKNTKKVTIHYYDSGNDIPVRVSSVNPLPVSATIDTSAVSTSANQTNGSQKTQIVDNGGSIAADVLDLTNSNPLTTALVDANGDQITSFGGGTQYTEGDTDASITGTAVMVEDTSNTMQPVPGDKTNGMDVDVTRSALPTGASTAAKQDTGNNSLSSIDGKITAVNTGAVVVSSSALPSGASTAAKQPALGTAGTASADVITVQGIASMTALKTDGSGVTQPVSGTVTETNSAAIKTAVETIDNAISGSEMQVDVVGALPAGTNAIGKLAANSGVDIGDVDVTSTVLPTGAGTSSVTSVADTTTSATLKASNTSRKQIIIQNTSSAILYVKYGATATSSDFTVLLNQNDILVEDHYTGIIDGIWATDPGDGAAKVTEIS